MFKKLICLVSFVLVLSLLDDVQAAQVNWTDASGDGLWNNPQNWDPNVVPTVDDDARIGMLPGPSIASEATCYRITVGLGGAPGGLTIEEGADIYVNNWFTLAFNNGWEGHLL